MAWNSPLTDYSSLKDLHMPTAEKVYFFNSSERSLFVEIYFPKRAAYYGAIFGALSKGYDEKLVKKYLLDYAPALINEFQAFPDLFKPSRYTSTKFSRTPPTVDEVLEQIEMYKSPFRGWSTYSVDGVFFDDTGKPIEEATQVVRLMFRFESSLAKLAIEEECHDVLRAILFWVISQHGRLYSHKVWGKEEQAQFIARHKPWPKQQLAFAKKYYADIALETGKWLDDREIFVFCYLVRNFWRKVVREEMREDEIWVASLFDLVLNVVKPTKPDIVGL